MRTTPAILALSAVAAAQQQIPFADQIKGWWSQASSVVASYGTAASATAAAAAHEIPNPVNAAAAAVAAGQVERLTLDNHKALLAPTAASAATGFEDWMVFVTGGNKTCFGFCGRADTEWNKSVPLLSATKGSPRLGRLDCEAEPILCHAWSGAPPSVMYIRVPHPHPDQSKPATEVRYIHLNRTSVDAGDIAALYTKEEYKKAPIDDSIWHPFDGFLATNGLAIPFGYALWGFSLIPSWAFMIGISMLSRTFMSRRMAPPPGPAQGGAGAAPAGR